MLILLLLQFIYYLCKIIKNKEMNAKETQALVIKMQAVLITYIKYRTSVDVLLAPVDNQVEFNKLKYAYTFAVEWCAENNVKL